VFHFGQIVRKARWNLTFRSIQLDSVVGENCILPEFPPKTLTSFGNFEPEFIEKRRELMEQFYRQIPPFAFSAVCLREFIGLDNPEVMRSAREIADRVVLLRPPVSAPYPSALPDTLTLSNGEEVFFHIIFDSVRDCLESMQTLHVRLSGPATIHAFFFSSALFHIGCASLHHRN
jgi:hypothetical protein